MLAISCLLALVLTLPLGAQTVYKVARAHLGNGESLAPAWISVAGGRIVAVSKDALAGEVVDCGAGEATAGMIDAWSSAGLRNADSENEEGSEVTPGLEPVVLHEANRPEVQRRLQQGITSLCIHPGTRAVISGYAGVVSTDSSSKVARVQRGFLCVNLGLDPAAGNTRGGTNAFYARRPNSRMGVVYDVRSTFLKVAEDLRAGRAIASEQMPLVEALQGKLTVLWYTQTEKEIFTALRLAEELGIQRNICAGVVSVGAAAAELKARGVPALMGAMAWPQYQVVRRGRRGIAQDDHAGHGHGVGLEAEVEARLRGLAAQGMTYPIDTREEALFDSGDDCCMAPGVDLDVSSAWKSRGPVTLQARTLAQNGVAAAFAAGSDVEGAFLIDYARLAVRDGLDAARAISMLTLEPARILGIAANKGSLEAGKDADLVIWTGDPLRPDSEPRLVIIEGRVVSDKSSGKGG
jgi:imidazolonepropionase-like amidohydrolase